MRILLDTTSSSDRPSRLKSETQTNLEDPDNEILFSAASIWEIAIKSALGKADFQVSPEEILESARESGFVELPVRSSAALKVAALPPHHRDPFDRLLMAQARSEPAQFSTTDRDLTIYSELVAGMARAKERPAPKA